MTDTKKPTLSEIKRIKKFIRRLVCRISGAPVCHACYLYGVGCVGHCRQTDEERTSQWVSQ